MGQANVAQSINSDGSLKNKLEYLENTAYKTDDTSRFTMTIKNDSITITLYGKSESGKSSLLRKYTKDTYDDKYDRTMVVEYAIKSFYVDGQDTKVDIWDTSGDEVFMSLIPMYIHKSNIVILCIDLTDPSSALYITDFLSKKR